MSSATWGGPVTVLDHAQAALGNAHPDQVWSCDDQMLLDQAKTAQTMINQLTAIHLRLVAEIDTRGSLGTLDPQRGWTTANLVVDHQPQSLATARATVKLGVDLCRWPVIAAAFGRGAMSREQARVLVTALDEIPDTIPADVVDAAQHTLIGETHRLNPAGLRRVAQHLVELIDPDSVDARLGDQLDADDAKARRSRYLSWSWALNGGLDLRGRLTASDGEAFIKLITAHTDALKAAEHAADPAGGPDPLGGPDDPDAGPVSAAQRRADALMTILGLHQQAKLAPDQGGDRPRVTVLVSLADLITGMAGATLCGTDQPIGPGEARRLACDADVLPAVLNGESVVLDAGRTRRLFTRELRHLLALRDRGCAFPGCPRSPAECDAHHINPWWRGGTTSLTNGVLLCPHHHRTVEPDPHEPHGTRWEVRLDPGGLPELIPPETIDPTRQPRQHQRFHERRLRPGEPSDPITRS